MLKTASLQNSIKNCLHFVKSSLILALNCQNLNTKTVKNLYFVKIISKILQKRSKNYKNLSSSLSFESNSFSNLSLLFLYKLPKDLLLDTLFKHSPIRVYYIFNETRHRTSSLPVHTIKKWINKYLMILFWHIIKRIESLVYT